MEQPTALFRQIPTMTIPLRKLLWQSRRRMALLGASGRLSIPSGAAIGAGCVFKPPHRATFGRNLSIGRNFHLEVDVEAGSSVVISSYVSFIGNDHDIDCIGRDVYTAPRLPPASVTIGDDVLIGFGSIVLGSVAIASGTVLGAGSLLTKSTVPGGVYLGRPAELRRLRTGYQ